MGVVSKCGVRIAEWSQASAEVGARNAKHEAGSGERRRTAEVEGRQSKVGRLACEIHLFNFFVAHFVALAACKSLQASRERWFARCELSVIDVNFGGGILTAEDAESAEGNQGTLIGANL